jgi:type II secretory pathway component HofQ
MLEEGSVMRVRVEFDGVPLEEAARDLADLTGVSVVIDKRVGRKAQEDVTATLDDVPVDTAVRLLADMAGLRMVVVDNVLYVTSRDNAKDLEAEQEKRKQRRMNSGGVNPGGPPA